jgi:hypothetical protein
MGVILQTQRAAVGDGDATVGSSVFDGDSLRADHDGLLRVRFGSSQAALLADTAAVVHKSADGFQADLTGGQMVVSSSEGQKFHVLADGAMVQPSSSQPTVAQVTWVSKKELVLTSRKGPLQVSMGDETKTISDGQSYRMIIDPAAASASPAPAAPGTPAAPQGTAASGSSLFILVLIGTAAAAVAIGVALALESPSAP